MTDAHLNNAEFLLEKIRESDAILVGAAAGFSAADGKRFWYEDDDEFKRMFGRFRDRYGIHSAFDSFYYPYRSEEERWAVLATFLHHLYEQKAGKVYKDLKILLQDKPYHIMTTNQDFLFFQDFPADKISMIQGDWRYFQRKDGGISDRIWDNREMVEKMYQSLEGQKYAIPSELLPRDPEDGMMLTPWTRHPGFQERTKYNDQYRMIREFLDKWKGKKILFLELGVGRMTPMFIQEPFWQLTYELPFAYYISINPRDAILPSVLQNKGKAIHEGIAEVFDDAVKILEKEKQQDKEAAAEEGTKQ